MKKILTLLFSVLLINCFAVCTFTITTTTLTAGYNFHPYTQSLRTSGSTGAVTFGLYGNSTLPTGLSLNTKNGTISGAVGATTNTTYTFAISAMDYVGCSAVRTYSVNFSNYRIVNTDYVIYSTQVNNAQQAPYYDDYDMVNNAYNVPSIVGVSPVTVSYPQTWYGNAPTYTVSMGANTSTTLGYKVYTALLNQSGTSAPTATVVDNTIGSIVWTRTGVGTYEGTLANAFTTNKTIYFISAGAEQAYYTIQLTSVNKITLLTYDVPSSISDNDLVNTSIEIRVYN